MVWIHQNGCTTPSFDPCNNVTQALELLEWYCTTYSEAGWNVFTTDIGCLWLGYFVRITEDTGEMHEACEASLPFAICKALDAALGGKADA
jgi:hypothetical protein